MSHPQWENLRGKSEQVTHLLFKLALSKTLNNDLLLPVEQQWKTSVCGCADMNVLQGLQQSRGRIRLLLNAFKSNLKM